jgi:hypothetical protein
MALTTNLRLSLEAVLTDPVDLSTPDDTLDFDAVIRLATGTGAGQADRMWHDRRTLAASATENLDLAGVLVNGLGDTQTFARLKAVVVRAAAANTNNVNVIREATNGVPLLLAAGDGVPVHPDGLFVWVAPGAAGVVVTPSTGDLITFTNSGAGTSVTYDVVLIGASA